LEANSEAFDFLRAGSGSIFYKTWGRDVEAEAGSGSWSTLKKKTGSRSSKLRSD